MNCKRITATLLCAVITFGIAILPFEAPVSLSAEAASVVDSGTCGKNASWQLDGDGILTVSGRGDMYSLNSGYSIPWEDKKNSIKQVVIGKGITSVGSQSFSDCTNLVTVTFSDTVTSIGSSAFSGCKSLTSVSLPESMTSISSMAFSLCKSLTDVSIPSSVTYIGSLAFSGTPWLMAEAEKSQFVIVNGMLLFAADIKEAVIPDSVTTIVSNAFWGHTLLEKLYIPNTVSTIEYNAFASCSSLTSVTIPASMKDIGMQAFQNCTALDDVTILSSDCKIFDRPTTFTNKGEEYTGVIKGYNGSTAEKYAQKYGYTFKSLAQLGDVNRDGEINAVDASSVLAYYAMISTNQNGRYDEYQKLAADVNHDGDINAVDASNILAYYAYASTTHDEIIKSMEEYIKK
ncbi:MAG: leucine-rich repeat protein [Ruminococcus sp.]|uniref:leucine-rich repeat protein n=1 Tax=Ruminococcus sp. TaxID=41978 RepID=UPI0025F7E774|nr:leucine-rich repeat protein [Ruminococcus sp.]MBR5682595.1 leucine-rich repeat protein [Ruminococcus sp.]